MCKGSEAKSCKKFRQAGGRTGLRQCIPSITWTCPSLTPLWAFGRTRLWNAAAAQSHPVNTSDRGSWSSVCHLSECADPPFLSSHMQEDHVSYSVAHTGYSL